MNILLRILLVAYAIVFIFFSILGMLVAINPHLLNNIYSEVNAGITSNYSSNIIIALISVILLISAIIFLLFGLKANKDKKAITKYTTIGEVNISLSSIESIVLNEASKISSIRNLKASISKVNEGISITIRGDVLPDVNIPLLSSELQESVKNAVEANTGISVSDVNICIESIYSGIAPKKKNW